jgi:hypothetical protein
MKLSAAAVLLALVAIQAAVLLAAMPTAQAGELQVGYYSKKCKAWRTLSSGMSSGRSRPTAAQAPR